MPPSSSLEKSIPPGEVDSLPGVTVSATYTGEVGEPMKHQDNLGDTLEPPPILNPPSTGEKDNSLKPSTNTDAFKNVSKEALYLNDDEQKRDASLFSTPPGGMVEDDADDLTPTNKEEEDKEGEYEGEKFSVNEDIKSEDITDSPPATNAEDDALRTRLNLSTL